MRSSLGLSWERTASERRTGSILAPRSSSFEALSSMRVSQVCPNPKAAIKLVLLSRLMTLPNDLLSRTRNGLLC